MRLTGKVSAALIGGLILGPLGAVMGLLIGHLFDLGYSQDQAVRVDEKVRHARKIFFQSTFTIMGYLAKVDGRVSEQEIQSAREVMARLELTQKQKILAIKYFNYGKSLSFNFNRQLETFRLHCGQNQYLVRLFAEIQIKSAASDHFDNNYKQYALEQICQKLHVPKDLIDSIQYQIKSERAMHEEQSWPHDEYAHACLVLGVTKEDDNQAIRKAYKLLVSQNHPDKLVAKGLPEELIKLANEKMQSIQKAYQVICRVRGMKR